MTLDRLGFEDVDDTLALSTAEGWNQTTADWRRLIDLEPPGCFAARDGGHLVGTVTTITYGRDLAWIGMMIVHPDFRRRGLGAQLMRLAMDHAHDLGIATVKLDATPAGRPLYESLGFAVEAELERWQGVARDAGHVARIDGHPRPSILALDWTAYDLDRARLLDRLTAEGVAGPLVSPQGYALARPGRTATYIGPVIAATAPAAEDLLDGMLARLAGTEVCLDLHRGGRLEPRTLLERGLSKRRGLLRMWLGTRSEAGTAPSICASTGPEFG